MADDFGTNPWITNYLRTFTKTVYGFHLKQVEELAAAFIARHKCDPEEAQTVTQFDEDTFTWTTYIERRTNGRTRHQHEQGPVPSVP